VGLPGAAVIPALPLTVRRAARLPTVDAVKAPPVRRRRPRRGFPTAVRRPRPASPTRRVGSRGGAGCSGSGGAELPPRHESAVQSGAGIGGGEWECSDSRTPCRPRPHQRRPGTRRLRATLSSRHAGTRGGTVRWGERSVDA